MTAPVDLLEEMLDMNAAPYAPMNRYPHFTDGETQVWTRFIMSNPGFFDCVFYDVCVGDYRGSENLNDHAGAVRRYVGKHKIDVLGMKDGVPCIVEVKREAGKAAMGEVWVYEELFKRDFPELGAPKLMIVCADAQANLKEIAERENVQFHIV